MVSPLVGGGPPEGERVVENVVPDRFHALVERKGRMFEREEVAQTVNVVNGVFVRFVPPLVRHADAESEPDGVSRLLFGPLLSEHRIVERRGRVLPAGSCAKGRTATRCRACACRRCIRSGSSRCRGISASVLPAFFGHGHDHRGDRIVVALTGRWGSPCPYM